MPAFNICTAFNLMIKMLCGWCYIAYFRMLGERSRMPRTWWYGIISMACLPACYMDGTIMRFVYKIKSNNTNRKCDTRKKYCDDERKLLYIWGVFTCVLTKQLSSHFHVLIYIPFHIIYLCIILIFLLFKFVLLIYFLFIDSLHHKKLPMAAIATTNKQK